MLFFLLYKLILKLAPEEGGGRRVEEYNVMYIHVLSLIDLPSIAVGKARGGYKARPILPKLEGLKNRRS